jgi:hypothetical protein
MEIIVNFTVLEYVDNEASYSENSHNSVAEFCQFRYRSVRFYTLLSALTEWSEINIFYTEFHGDYCELYRTRKC